MKLFFTIALLFFALPHPSFAGTLSFVSQGRWVQVDKIYDGDTFRTLNGEKIRLLGINTPEIAHTSSPGQTMGKKASRALRKLIAGKVVRLAFDEQRRDTYQRTLAQIYLRDGTWVNGKMVELGMAHVYTFTPNLRWAGDLTTLEQQARREKRGIWKTKRFSMLDATQIKTAHLGQFRVVRGQVGGIKKKGYSFRLGALNISIPRKYRRFFKHPPVLRSGDSVIVHGVVRAASSGLYLPLHSPFDLEIIRP
ncbi:MAG: thermonuclease family protein [Mariprofundaceae bacterium]|nr:thermonuclease family protein [Mariprofundaceae bacterium]